MWVNLTALQVTWNAKVVYEISKSRFHSRRVAIRHCRGIDICALLDQQGCDLGSKPIAPAKHRTSVQWSVACIHRLQRMVTFWGS